MEVNKIRIIVAFQKESFIPEDRIYLPIRVGAVSLTHDCFLKRHYWDDNTGDEISAKNNSYCELTAIYWAWKNLKNADIIGLCHYRRYLDYHNQCRSFFPYTSFSDNDCKSLKFSVDEKIISSVKKGKIIVAKAIKMPCTLKQNYCEYHLSEDYEALRKIFETECDDKFKLAFEEVFEYGYELYPYNIFLMRWNDFEVYCNWLFPLLQKLEMVTNIDNYSPFQKRIYGFMAERLFNIWLKAERKDVIEKPVIFVEDNIQNKLIGPRKLAKQIFRNVCSYLINRLYIFRMKI